jgi:tetratricopeptide (TPR) repeat protein
MPSGPGERYDFFLSRRGSVAAIAREVADVLTEKGYRVLVQDYDILLGASFVDAMHEAVKNSRDLVILFTRDYEQSPYTRKEFTSFEAERAQSQEKRHIIVLRCEDEPLRGLLADNVYQDLVGIQDPEERKRRIIAAAERHSQAAPPPPRPFISVPPRIASFTGRADELDRLDAILMHDKPAAVTQAVGRAAVQGMGGVGKTSLAIEYAHRYRNFYAGVCWCPAETRVGLLGALATLAVTMGAATAEEADVEKAAKAALRRLAEQRATWLLLYDNVTAPDHIADLLPAAGARVLITSRFSDWGEVADEVALDLLPPEQAVALLECRSGCRDAAGASTLAEALGRLPLALDHAAAYCKRTQIQFGDYAAKASSLIDAAPRGAGYPRSIAATFNLAITEAVAQCTVAEALMAYLAQCAPERIPMTLVEGAVEDQAELRQALTALAEVSLLKHDPFADATPAVTVHRLVQAVARARSEASGSAQDVIARLIARLVAIYPGSSHTNNPQSQSWPLFAQLTPHLLARRDECLGDTPVVAGWPELLNSAATYFLWQAGYSQAAPLLRAALATRERVLGPEHPDTARSLNDFANVLQRQGDLGGARPLYERALAILEKALAPEHPDTATSLRNLASLLQEQRDFAGARRLYERALAIRAKVFGPDHPHTAVILNKLASLLQEQGDFAGARPLYERALTVLEKEVLGPEHPDTAAIIDDLASLLQEPWFLPSDPIHPSTAQRLARPLFEGAVAIYEKAHGPEHPNTALILHKLANLRQEEGDFAGARALYERALAIYEKAHGPEHRYTASILNNLADLLRAQGDFAGARPLYERALAVREKALGPEHPDTATSLSNLAVLLCDIGRASEAEPLFYQAMAIGEKALGPGHPLTQRYRSRFARLLVTTDRTSEALALGEAALATHEIASGRNHPWTKDSARVTADALRALGRTEEAQALRRRYGLTPPENLERSSASK